MEYIYIGDIVNTHGIKGEIRILSNFKYKNLVFKPNFKIYIGKEKTQEIISSYRQHKNYDMICLNSYNNINQVLKYKGKPVYINRLDLNVPYLNSDLINFTVYNKNKEIGKLTNVREIKDKEFLVINNKILIPNIDRFVKKIDLNNKKIIIETIKGMLDKD